MSGLPDKKTAGTARTTRRRAAAAGATAAAAAAPSGEAVAPVVLFDVTNEQASRCTASLHCVVQASLLFSHSPTTAATQEGAAAPASAARPESPEPHEQAQAAAGDEPPATPAQSVPASPGPAAPGATPTGLGLSNLPPMSPLLAMSLHSKTPAATPLIGVDASNPSKVTSALHAAAQVRLVLCNACTRLRRDAAACLSPACQPACCACPTCQRRCLPTPRSGPGQRRLARRRRRAARAAVRGRRWRAGRPSVPWLWLAAESGRRFSGGCRRVHRRCHPGRGGRPGVRRRLRRQPRVRRCSRCATHGTPHASAGRHVPLAFPYPCLPHTCAAEGHFPGAREPLLHLSPPSLPSLLLPLGRLVQRARALSGS